MCMELVMYVMNLQRQNIGLINAILKVFKMVLINGNAIRQIIEDFQIKAMNN